VPGRREDRTRSIGANGGSMIAIPGTTSPACMFRSSSVAWPGRVASLALGGRWREKGPRQPLR
jgi:hypothetical protein